MRTVPKFKKSGDKQTTQIGIIINTSEKSDDDCATLGYDRCAGLSNASHGGVTTT